MIKQIEIWCSQFFLTFLHLVVRAFLRYQVYAWFWSEEILVALRFNFYCSLCKLRRKCPSVIDHLLRWFYQAQSSLEREAGLPRGQKRLFLRRAVDLRRCDETEWEIFLKILKMIFNRNLGFKRKNKNRYTEFDEEIIRKYRRIKFIGERETVWAGWLSMRL